MNFYCLTREDQFSVKKELIANLPEKTQELLLKLDSFWFNRQEYLNQENHKIFPFFFVSNYFYESESEVITCYRTGEKIASYDLLVVVLDCSFNTIATTRKSLPNGCLSFYQQLSGHSDPLTLPTSLEDSFAYKILWKWLCRAKDAYSPYILKKYLQTTMCEDDVKIEFKSFLGATNGGTLDGSYTFWVDNYSFTLKDIHTDKTVLKLTLKQITLMLNSILEESRPRKQLSLFDFV